MTSPDPEHDLLTSEAETGGAPQHGDRGDTLLPPPRDGEPGGLTIALSREAGSHGGSIALRVGRKLGWPVYNQELLEYLSQEVSLRDNLMHGLSPTAARWAEQRLDQLLREQNLSQNPAVMNLARVVLALGAQGDVIMVGRGAGCILPPAVMLHVRTIAPLADRVAYMSQWLRLTVEEAAEQVRLRDQKRAEFVATHFHRQPHDPYQYDLLLNSSLLGEELCADLIIQAVRAKSALRAGKMAPT
ncbi:MAG: AAA family ATPase [Gemmataceae bacterium]